MLHIFFCKNCFYSSPDIDSDEPDISPPPLHSVREVEREAEVLQGIGIGSQPVKSNQREAELLQGIGRGRIVEREENLDTKRLMKGDKGSLQQEYGGEAIEGTSDAYEWVDFKRNGELWHFYQCFYVTI